VANTSYVAFLRAINLGPRNRIAMADLRAAVAGAGFDDVTTHIQTGNVLVTSSPNRAGAMEAAIKDAIRTELGRPRLRSIEVGRAHARTDAGGAADRSQLERCHHARRPGRGTLMVSSSEAR
jgi:hypothetical protein